MYDEEGASGEDFFSEDMDLEDDALEPLDLETDGDFGLDEEDPDKDH